MLKSHLIVALTTAALLPVFPVLAQEQGASTPPPPPGPYQAMRENPSFTGQVQRPNAQPQAQVQQPSLAATQVWGPPRGMAIPYWMRPPNQTPAVPGQNGASVLQMQPAPVSQTPVTNSVAQATVPYGMQVAPGFYPSYGAAQTQMQAQMQAGMQANGAGNGTGNGMAQNQGQPQRQGQAQNLGLASTYPAQRNYGAPFPPFPGFQQPYRAFPGYGGYGAQAPMPYWGAPMMAFNPNYQPGYPVQPQGNR